MTHLRPWFTSGLAATLVLLLSPAAPAQAAGKDCVTNDLSKRCAAVVGDDGDIVAVADINSTRSRSKVRIVSISLQRQTGDGWVTVSRNEPPQKMWLSGGDSIFTVETCSSAQPGKYRSLARMQWKLGADGEVRTGRVASDAVRKSRLCA